MQRLVVTICLSIASLVFGVAATCRAADDAPAQSNAVTPELRDRSVAILRETNDTAARWVKVHAAEYLIALNYPQGVYKTFQAERHAYESQPKYRVGIWRVLAQSAANAAERQEWIDRIRAVVIDPQASDHVHAIETLAKLGDRLESPALRDAVIAAALPDLPTTSYARWLLAGSGKASDLAHLAELLDSTDSTHRLVTAYALQWMRIRDVTIRQKLATVAQAEPADSPARIYLISAAWILAIDETSAQSFRSQLLTAAEKGSPSDRAVVSAALGQSGTLSDLVTLQKWLNDSDPDVQANAAAAILKIGLRLPAGKQ